MVRVKFRYLVVNFLYPEPSTKSKTLHPDLIQIHSPTPDAVHVGILIRMIRDEITRLYGDHGMGMVASGLKVNYYSPCTSTAIIRCPRDHYEMVWAALTFTTRFPKPVDIPVVVRVARVSGTIKKAEEEVIRRAQLIIRRAKAMDGKMEDPMLREVQKSVVRESRKETEVLATVDNDMDSE